MKNASFIRAYNYGEFAIIRRHPVENHIEDILDMVEKGNQ